MTQTLSEATASDHTPPGLAEEFNEDLREAGEWVWWGCFDPFVFGLVMVAEAIRRRLR
jgi:hypothetical protein